MQLFKLLAVVLAVSGAGVPGSGERATVKTTKSDEAAFKFSAERIPASVRRRMTGVSWRRGCPVPLSRLRYLKISHRTFDGRVRTGELIVHKSAVRTMRRVFAELYEAKFPIRRMRLIDDYDGSDFDSIEADNTSAFNCRERTGGGGWSEHAYGRAIDVNPIENPYVHADGTTSHRASKKYLDRSRWRKGMATRNGVLVRSFKDAGWGWGGDWPSPKDFQHFSRTGR